MSEVDELNKLLTDFMPIARKVAEQEMKKHAVKGGIGEGKLKDSIDAFILSASKDLLKEVMVSFRLYGRWKDMRYVEYDQSDFRKPNNSGKKYGQRDDEPPEIVQGMMEFIKAKGFNKFKFIPGYTTNASKRMPITARAVERLAWAMAIKRLRTGRVNNKRSKKWYNSARSSMVNVLSKELSEKVAPWLAKNVAGGIEKF